MSSSPTKLFEGINLVAIQTSLRLNKAALKAEKKRNSPTRFQIIAPPDEEMLRIFDTAARVAPSTPSLRIEAPRRERVKIVTGMMFGSLKILKKGTRIKAARPNLEERWRCECTEPGCGKQIIVPRYYLLRPHNPKTHCGCKVKTLKSTNQREYRIWMMIHQRLFNPRHESYKHYQERGITLFAEWHKDNKDGFKKFFEHVGTSPTQWHSLDRVNNNKGYEPGNLKWSTATEQRANQGDRIGGYTSEEIADMGFTEDEFVELIIQGKIK